ncbi:MAG: hypothetical protein ACRDPI_05435 [Nocardioidaceae bacterium]
MTTETEQRLAEALRRAVPDDPSSPLELNQLAEGARARAKRLRSRARLAGAGIVAVVVAAVAIPLALSGGEGPASIGPASSPSTSPSVSTVTDCSAMSCDPAHVASVIRKPLRLPRLASGAACPSGSEPTPRFPAGAGFSAPFRALGTGPLYIGSPHEGGVIRLQGPKNGWWSQKVIWVLGSLYPGPVLLRGGRVDGPGKLRFDRYLGAAHYGRGDHGRYPQLLYVGSGLPVPAHGVLTSYPADFFVTAPGCYAIQVDGVGFSRLLYFEASPTNG